MSDLTARLQRMADPAYRGVRPHTETDDLLREAAEKHDKLSRRLTTAERALTTACHEHAYDLVEITRLEQEIMALRVSLGQQSASDSVEPIGCPCPGACAAGKACAQAEAALAAMTQERDSAKRLAAHEQQVRQNIESALGAEQQRLAARTRERDDWKLAFEKANELVGEYNADARRAEARLTALREWLEQELDMQGTPAICEWREDVDHDGCWDTGCGRSVCFDHSDAPSTRDQKFCAYCGKPLHEVCYVEPAE